jgi:plastocyanin
MTAVVLLGGGQAMADPGAGQEAHVSIDNQVFYNPPVVQIANGGKVVWSFEDGDNPHTVTADDNSFGSDPNGRTSGTYEHVFSTSGMFTYHCDFHPVMTGRVSVR